MEVHLLVPCATHQHEHTLTFGMVCLNCSLRDSISRPDGSSICNCMCHTRRTTESASVADILTREIVSNQILGGERGKHISSMTPHWENTFLCSSATS